MYFKRVNGKILCVGEARFINNGIGSNIKYPRQNKCDIVGGEVVALLMIAVVASLMSAPLAMQL